MSCSVFEGCIFCSVANKIEFAFESQFVDVNVPDMCERIQHGGIQDGLHEWDETTKIQLELAWLFECVCFWVCGDQYVFGCDVLRAWLWFFSQK